MERLRKPGGFGCLKVGKALKDWKDFGSLEGLENLGSLDRLWKSEWLGKACKVWKAWRLGRLGIRLDMKWSSAKPTESEYEMV